MSVTKNAIVSDIGNDHHTPSTPIDGGRMTSNGSRKIIWRDSERKMLILALPIDWKKLVVTA